MNVLNYVYMYNGGGVATADFNNDGLVDIYFTANQESNALYINQGKFKFKDMTQKAGVLDSLGWTNGVSVFDVDNDGWLDLYVCKSGLESPSSRENLLYRNKGDGTFEEVAEKWGLNDNGYSTQSYFFDYDKDGDLDMYLVNHRIDFDNTSSINKELQNEISPYTSDQLYRNDDGFYTNVTSTAGMLNKAWGLSAAIGDFNGDNWPDVYVCNDFLEPDILYINQGDGTFTDEILKRMNHISFNSMGSDYADINNDKNTDLLVLEMASEDHIRSKRNMATMNTKNFEYMVKQDYHHQYMVNTFQLNQGNGMFSEIAQLTGMSKTDWSWAPLIADFDNDGLKDIFVTNGILKDLNDQDFKGQMDKMARTGKIVDFEDVGEILPNTRLSNYGFKNNGNLSFENVTKLWGLDTHTQSNGISYADLDNDGDLDLVINNINDHAQIYENNDVNNFIQIILIGDEKNRLAVGAKVNIKADDSEQYQELYLSRGYLSSVQNLVHFGVGTASIIDEIVVEWPNQEISILQNIEANQIVFLNQEGASTKELVKSSVSPPIVALPAGARGITFEHRERYFDDYKNQVLLPHSQSRNGPFMDKADVNGDGLDDFFIGGAAGQSGQLYIQKLDGSFERQNSDTWKNDWAYEDLGVLFFDWDGDGDQDLYVVSGSSEFLANSDLLQDRIYNNDGKGNFLKDPDILPRMDTSGQCVKVSDIDIDGDLDIFVGGRIVPDKYPFSPNSFMLINENGKFVDKTKSVAPSLTDIGMVTDASFSDYDGDGDQDLIVVGEWMPITLLENDEGIFRKKEIKSLQKTEGLWFSIAANDIDNDGDMDYFIGNLGLNTKFKANEKKEFHVFCDDFDKSGTYDIILSNKYKGALVPSRGKECTSQQMPFIKEKFKDYASFAEATIQDILGVESIETALHYEAKILESILLENLGNGQFKIRKLPNKVQIAPIMDFEFVDMDGNDTNEILVVGNHYNSEVETVRYDASYGSVLSFDDGNIKAKDLKDTGFVNRGDAKDICTLLAKNERLILVSNNNGRIQSFILKEK